MKEVAKEIRLDLSQIPETSRTQAKNDVGEFVVNEILRFVSRGSSPVEGENFARLSKEYADKEKGGNRTPNLELDGDMLDSLTFQSTTSGIKVGIFDSSEVPKADGHNDFSGDSKLPTRRFIPKGTQDFRPSIQTGINEIVNRYRTDVSFLDENLFPSAIAIAAGAVSNAQDIDIDEILSPFLGGL